MQQDAAGVREGIPDGARARRYAAAWRGAPQRRGMYAVNAFGGAATAELAGGEEEEAFGAGPSQVRESGWA